MSAVNSNRFRQSSLPLKKVLIPVMKPEKIKICVSMNRFEQVMLLVRVGMLPLTRHFLTVHTGAFFYLKTVFAIKKGVALKGKLPMTYHC